MADCNLLNKNINIDDCDLSMNIKYTGVGIAFRKKDLTNVVKNADCTCNFSVKGGGRPFIIYDKSFMPFKGSGVKPENVPERWNTYAQSVQFPLIQNDPNNADILNALNNDGTWVYVLEVESHSDTAKNRFQVFNLESGGTTTKSEFMIDGNVAWDVVSESKKNVNPSFFLFDTDVATTLAKYEQWLLDVEYINTLSIGNGSITPQKVYLKVDSDKTCYAIMPNGTIYTSTSGVINQNYSGGAGKVTLVIPKNTTLIDYAQADFIDVQNVGIKSLFNFAANTNVVDGVINTNNTTLFHLLDSETRTKIISATTKGWNNNVSNYVPNISKVMHIGNSITLSTPTSYWWGTWGMAATFPQFDYVNLFNAQLNNDYDTSVIEKRLNISGWESNHALFDKSTLNSNFDGDEDLIVLKVGENVSSSVESLATWTADYVDLVQYIQGKCPNAKIVPCGSFWADAGGYVDAGMENAAIALNLPFIYLSSLDTVINRSTVDTQVWGDDNQFHTISDGGGSAAAVAMHPSNAGMAAISQLIYGTSWEL